MYGADEFVLHISFIFISCLWICELNWGENFIGKSFTWLREKSERKKTGYKFPIFDQCQWYIVSTIISINSLFVIDSIVLMPMNLYRNQF